MAYQDNCVQNSGGAVSRRTLVAAMAAGAGAIALGVVSEQFFKPPLTVVGLGHARPIPILQQLARSDPSGRNDVRAVPTVVAKRQGCLGGARDRNQP